MSIKYTISREEITRRKRAFATLSVSLMTGMVLASIDFIIENTVVSVIIVFILSLAFAFWWAILSRGFDSFSKMNISLTDHHQRRDNGKKIEHFALEDIKSIRVKRTTKATVREI